jgi:hypothetical protein
MSFLLALSSAMIHDEMDAEPATLHIKFMCRTAVKSSIKTGAVMKSDAKRFCSNPELTPILHTIRLREG